MRRLALDTRRSQIIVVLDQGVFGRKHKKPHHFPLGAVFNPLGHGPWAVASGGCSAAPIAEELFAGQKAFIRQSRSGWCMIGLDSADVIDVADVAFVVRVANRF